MKKILSIIIYLLLACITAFAQKTTVRGTVVDNTGTPVAGAYVVDNASKTGVNTDVDGKYFSPVKTVIPDDVAVMFGDYFGQK